MIMIWMLSNMKELKKTRLTLKIGTPLLIETISQSLDGVSIIEIQRLLEGKILEHYQKFGQQPFSIIYDRQKRGYTVQAEPVIGIINCIRFDIKIIPKIPKLEIGKCLQLSHHCQLNSIVKHTNTLVEKELSSSSKLFGIDYFATAFLSAITDVINNNLLRTISSIEEPDPNFRGTLLLTRHIMTGGNPLLPYTRRPISIIDIPVNRTLKAALEVCRLHSNCSEVKSLTSSALTHFKDVSENHPNEPFKYTFESSLPREEYSRALTFAEIILEGFDPTSGQEELFFPYFTINLDQLFEKFIAFELQHKLKPDIYNVLIQKQYPHPAQPNISNKFVEPDIVVERRNGEGNKVVIDTKNKYSMLSDNSSPNISNNDIYQIAYYCLMLKSNTAILVYPGNAETTTDYPIRSSEGETVYERKRQRVLESLKSNASTHLSLSLGMSSISIYFWRINLEGTMQETMESVVKLAFFITDAIKGRL